MAVRDRVELRLIGGQLVTFEFTPGMSEESWDHMMRYLELMREAIVPAERCERGCASCQTKEQT